MRFEGVDQTGAARRKGLAAAPLPAVVLERDVLRATCLASFTATEVAAQGWADAVIAVDVVFGLPSSGWVELGRRGSAADMWDLMASAHAHTWQGRRFGRAVAKAFFAGLDPGGDGLRAVDRRAGAMSVFRTVPYQRNVQTGTYRVWRDMGAADRWCSLWPFDVSGAGPVVAEAYPTWGWRNLVGSATRDVERLRVWLDEHQVCVADPKILSKPDYADAAVNALVARRTWREGRVRRFAHGGEGGILGLSDP